MRAHEIVCCVYVCVCVKNKAKPRHQLGGAVWRRASSIPIFYGRRQCEHVLHLIILQCTAADVRNCELMVSIFRD